MLQEISVQESKEQGSYYTQKEIAQQPALWQQTYDYMLREREHVQSFLKTITDKHSTIKVILTGAGTSAFLGECMAPYLSDLCDRKQYIFQAIPTTNIVSNPTQYLDPQTPTLMVSYARSGNSPESVASAELGEQLIDDFYQINITCNPDGQLAANTKNNERALGLLMPEESNDQGFAMTSSFTCMMLATLLTFQNDRMAAFRKNVDGIVENTNMILSHDIDRLQEIAKLSFTNITYLGSGPFLGLSHEAALKMLELTGGQVFTSHESLLGFRHGPKSLLNDHSLVAVMISSDPYTQRYDVDMLRELYEEKENHPLQVMAISDGYVSAAEHHSDHYFYNSAENTNVLDDGWGLFPFVVCAQILAFYKSVMLGFQPDNPSANGSVNRVVQGVTIYPYENN